MYNKKLNSLETEFIPFVEERDNLGHLIGSDAR
jgi:hypothetical protein